MRYHNLDLDVFDYQSTAAGETMKVRVASPLSGDTRYTDAESVVIPADLRNRISQIDNEELALDELIQYGEQLAAILLPPQARRLFERSRDRLTGDDRLRIRLRLEAYALAELPWEYLYIAPPDTPASQKGAAGFLALDPQISIVRYELLGQPRVSLDPVGSGPIRLVMLMANPRDPDYEELDLDREQGAIARALENVQAITAEYYRDATVDVLEEALIHGAHIFHFAGHGEFEPGDIPGQSRAGKGYLVLLDEARRARRFSAERLAINLRSQKVRLAFLGACEGGRRDTANAWTGVAPALAQAGIPAIVAMQFSVYDDNATAFSSQFYRTLAAGQPIDAAVTNGRRAMFNRSPEDSNDRDWGVPVLYLRSDEGVLFPSSTPAPTPAAPRIAGGSGVPHPATASSPAVNKTTLRKALVQAFTINDMKLLCADIQQRLADNGIDVKVSADIVGGDTSQMLAFNLIDYLDRRKLLSYLIDTVREQQPGLI